MRPFHPPRPSAAQPHHPRPGDPGQPLPHALPMHQQQQMNPAAFPGFGAANPMAAVAAANPFLAMQLFGQAQQLQNLGYLAAAALQQQQQQQHHHHQPQQQQNPFLPGGFPPNPNQFGAFPGPQSGFNGGGGGGFRPGGAGLAGPRPPLPMMGAAWNGGSGGGGVGVNASPRPALNLDGKDRNSGGGVGQVNQTNNKSDGTSHVASENGVRNNATDQKSRFNPGRDGKDGRQFGPSGGRGRGDSRGGGQFNPSGGRGRGDSRGGGQFSPSGGRGRGDGRDGRFSPSGGRGRGRNFNQGRGRGRNDWREGKSNFTSSDSPISGDCHIDSPASEGVRKRPPIIYDKKEVKQWVQARKKNYPTSANINKKLCQSQLDEQKKDEEAQMRRRELKEVIAKQKELGLELPELPPGYLSDTEGQPRGRQGNEKESNWKTRQGGGRFGNRGRGRGRGRGRDNKRQRSDDREDFQSKRPRERNNNSRRHDGGAMAKSREPTLLQKLLNSDIKRDRHRLLHTFKFMALNNFFKDWPAKPLEFPIVKVDQIELESDIDEEDSDDDLPDAETAKDSSLGLKENGHQPESSSSDEEDGSEDDDDEADDKGADTEITEKVSDEDTDAEQCEQGFSDFSA
ncbi:hypothetical protein ACQJBY_028392 [Aegilops geniculata]